MTRHSFGGHALDRFLFDFETVLDGTTDSAPVGAEPAAEPAGDVQTGTEGAPSPEPSAPTGAAPAIDWNSHDAQAAIAAGTVQALQAFVAANQPPDPGFDWENADPFDTAQLGEGIKQMLQQELDARLGPVQQLVQRDQLRESQAWTDSQFERLGVPAEDRNLALFMAGGIETAAQAEGQRVSGEQIMGLAHSQLAEHDKRVGDAAVAKYVADLNTAATAPSTPANGSPAVEGFPDDSDELATARRLMQARSAA